MSSVDQMKDWLLKKAAGAARMSPTSRTSRGGSNYFSVVVTPNNIPEFVIPGSPDTVNGSRLSPPAADDPSSPLKEMLIHSQSSSSTTSPHQSPVFPGTPRESSPSLFLPLPTGSQSCSAPVSPRGSVSNSLNTSTSGEVKARSLPSVETRKTNADPFSSAAMELTHFKTKTSFGFDTLAERPHTRRKESLFHADHCRPCMTRSMSLTGVSIGSCLGDSNAERSGRASMKCRPVIPMVIKTPSPSAGSSPDNSPLPSPVMSPGLLHAPFSMRVESTKTDGHVYYRRRSSLLVLGDGECPICSSEDTLAKSPPPQSVSCEDTRKSPVNKTKPLNRSLSLSQGLIKCPPPLPAKCPHHGSLQKMEREDGKMLAEHGELKFSIQYLPESRRLKVLLIRAEELGGFDRNSPVNPLIRLSLRPGKIQKQQSKVIKGNANPVFNQEFFFSGLSMDHLKGLVLKMKVFNKPNNIKREEFLGEVRVPLEAYDLITENRMWQNLVPKMTDEDLGQLQFKCCFEPNRESLKVEVIGASALPRHHIAGAPDPYVKVVLSQPGRTDIKHQTKTRRKSINPSYNESFQFKISPKIADLKYTTLTFVVYDHVHLRSDDAIGKVSLGYKATQSGEFEHWAKVLQTPGGEFEHSHKIVENDSV